MLRFRCVCALGVVVATIFMSARSWAENLEKLPASVVSLNYGWQIQSSCEAKATGQQISTPGFEATGWHKTTVPNTVVGTLVDDKTYPAPMYGMNLKKLPGMNYSDKSFFALQDMPEGSPFRCSWWWRTEFAVKPPFSGEHFWLHFPGINYRANVWVNGKKIADAKDVAGTYRIFEFDVTSALNTNGQNAVALEIFAPGKDDLGITWVDWNPTPADKDMGIWKEVTLSSSGPVAVRNAFVKSKLGAEYKTAELTLSGDLRNQTDKSVRGTLVADVDGQTLKQDVELAAGETKTVRFAAAQFPQLKLEHPRLWLPYTLGTPNLYTAELHFHMDKGENVSDHAQVTFGIREFTSELTEKGHRLFKLNGRNILIRGAAWAPDMFLRPMSKKLDADLAYVRDMGLNTIRLEGRIDRDEFFEKTDKLGILVMPGWTCCDTWERWKRWTPETHAIAKASMADQARRLRNHASVFVWLYGSDGPPPADVEQMYLDVLKEAEWPNPALSSASNTPTKLTGNSGVKMTGPYEYVPPVYWLADTKAGGAYGYNTETSPGPAIPTRESLEKFIPTEHLWPIDDVWNYHAGKERFTTVNVFTDGLTRRYGPATSLNDYERKAQAMTYDGQRAMFEAYGRNKYTSTGVIQWMLNNSWPSLIWHLYDYYLVPAGGYFGTKKAMEPVHVQYGYDDHSVAVVNDTRNAVPGVKVSATIYNLDATQVATDGGTLDLASDSSTKVLDLPLPDKISTTYFLKLKLHDAQGKLLSDNFYWLSTKVDTLDWAKRKDTVYTPQKDFADLSGLNSLPQVTLSVHAAKTTAGGRDTITVTVKNPSSSIAFMAHLRLTSGPGGDDVVPIFWSDNYFSLLPDEERVITANYDVSGLDGKAGVLVMDGYNVVSSAVQPASSRAAAN
ncbi:MAG: glycosyl hydrolase family 2 [Acidobacteria bacterium]|nr:MAG: glycosyl hydrolase family 2 [Acidobacteriota bacterium]